MRKIATVKKSYYKSANLFSEIHRNLPFDLCLTDIDHVQYIIDGEDTLYLEYKIDQQKKPKFIAIFDYKHCLSDRLKMDMQVVRIGTSLWAQMGLAEKINVPFIVICATEGKMPLNFYKASKTSFQFVGTLSDSSPDVLQNFWRNNLRLI